MAANTADIAAGTKVYEAAIKKTSDTNFMCRQMKHAWTRKPGTNVQVNLPVTRGDLPTITTIYVCMRGCGVIRKDRLTVKQISVGNYRVIDKAAPIYEYPDGYRIPGIPRGVRPSIILQQEYVRRANEEIANAMAGERERSE
jgi:hypothetical protein